VRIDNEKLGEALAALAAYLATLGLVRLFVVTAAALL